MTLGARHGGAQAAAAARWRQFVTSMCCGVACVCSSRASACASAAKQRWAVRANAAASGSGAQIAIGSQLAVAQCHCSCSSRAIKCSCTCNARLSATACGHESNERCLACLAPNPSASSRAYEDARLCCNPCNFEHVTTDGLRASLGARNASAMAPADSLQAYGSNLLIGTVVVRSATEAHLTRRHVRKQLYHKLRSRQPRRLPSADKTAIRLVRKSRGLCHLGYQAP